VELWAIWRDRTGPFRPREVRADREVSRLTDLPGRMHRSSSMSA
jgi:hypothetical protein